jgi:hypothetical protein
MSHSHLTITLTDTGYKLHNSTTGVLLAEAKSIKAIRSAKERFISAAANVRWPEA